MRKFLVCIMAGALFLASGCGTEAQPAATGQPVSQEGISQDNTTQGERSIPGGGAPDRGGRGFSGQTEFTYSGEQKTYALTEDVKITKDTGENSETLAITDLIKDDVVRLEFDENGEIISVQLQDLYRP